jgi:isoquinoline 1-oxidoreductase alpha subunit
MATTRFTVNDKSVELEIDPRTPLLWVLRDTLNLTGTKYGCGIGQCGACTVIFEGDEGRCQSAPFRST